MPPFDAATVLIQLVGGLLLLAAGAELLVRGAARLARSLGVSAMVVGLTVVAFGTSSPEMSVSVFAAMRGQADIAVGNAIGSNIFNLLAILGFTALLCPIAVQGAFVRREIPVMIVVCLLLPWVGADELVERREAGLLLALLLLYVLFAYWIARRESGPAAESFEQGVPKPAGSTGVNLFLIVLGLAMLVGGSHFLVEGSVAIARRAGLSEAVIGLTLVAAGTSLPELAASAVAALRRQPDIALGNIIGSNVFNILAIVGLSGVLRPLRVSPELLHFDVWVMLAASVLVWPMTLSGRRISRWEGLALFAGYVGYTGYVVLHALGGV